MLCLGIPLICILGGATSEMRHLTAAEIQSHGLLPLRPSGERSLYHGSLLLLKAFKFFACGSETAMCKRQFLLYVLREVR